MSLKIEELIKEAFPDGDVKASYHKGNFLSLDVQFYPKVATSLHIFVLNTRNGLHFRWTNKCMCHPNGFEAICSFRHDELEEGVKWLLQTWEEIPQDIKDWNHS